MSGESWRLSLAHIRRRTHRKGVNLAELIWLSWMPSLNMPPTSSGLPVHPSFEVLFPLSSLLLLPCSRILHLPYFTHSYTLLSPILSSPSHSPSISFLFSRRSFVPRLPSEFTRSRLVASRSCQPLQTHIPQDHVAGFHSVNPRSLSSPAMVATEMSLGA